MGVAGREPLEYADSHGEEIACILVWGDTHQSIQTLYAHRHKDSQYEMDNHTLPTTI